MTDHFDALETIEPAMREADLFARLPDVLRKATAAMETKADGWHRYDRPLRRP